MTKTITLRDQRINWTWYAEIEISSAGTRCKVLKHYRLHDFRDPDHPKTVGTFSMQESTQRHVTGITIWRESDPKEGTLLEVLNSRHVFDYP